VLRSFERAKEAASRKNDTDAITILNTVHDASGKWDLGKDASSLIDVLIMDLDEAKCISGMDIPNDHMPALVEWFQKQGFRSAVITNGTDGAYMYSTDDNIFLPTVRRLALHIPASRYVMELDRPKYGLGCGDVTAGALAVAIAEHMDLQTAGLFAMSAGGACALVEPGEIGGPCPQGGQRKAKGHPTVFEQVYASIRNQYDPGPAIMKLPELI
jgi:sugar/nucleoside kinase (ribokinase family)